jgi:MoaA/NifB/PqqE/SkfB family radical SAM enzyme
MKPKTERHAWVDEEGRLVVPACVASQYGLRHEAQVSLDNKDALLRIHPSVNRLAKVYIEPTNRCNLDCTTCMRNDWNEALGRMERSTFEKIVAELEKVSPPPTIFFGGLGEPLLHPDIVEMVEEAKTFSPFVEIITNGTLLTPTISNRLMGAGLDMLWVSLDGASPESYADVRLGATLPQVLKNLAAFQQARLARNVCPNCKSAEGYNFYDKPLIGIVFVAMKRNIRDLPALLEMCNRYAVSRFMVSNLLPYTQDMCSETLYSKTLMETTPLTTLELPRMDVNEITAKSLRDASRTGYSLMVGGANSHDASNRCPFIHAGASAISWDGKMSPCIPLLHSHTRYVNDRAHLCGSYVVGNVNDRPLRELWTHKEYVRFRERVQLFEFSPCTACGGCDLSENNEEDCQGNTFPTCGTCPWAQGVIQCP